MIKLEQPSIDPFSSCVWQAETIAGPAHAAGNGTATAASTVAACLRDFQVLYAWLQMHYSVAKDCWRISARRIAAIPARNRTCYLLEGCLMARNCV